MQIIVTGHGKFASGIESTVKLLAGKINGVSYIDFTEDMGEADLKKKFEVQIQNDDHVLFFCDLLGGTPFKQAAVIKMENEGKDISVVSGCNVASLLENGLKGLDKFENSDQLADAIITSCKAGIKKLGDLKVSQNDDSVEDGI